MRWRCCDAAKIRTETAGRTSNRSLISYKIPRTRSHVMQRPGHVFGRQTHAVLAVFVDMQLGRNLVLAQGAKIEEAVLNRHHRVVGGME